MTLQGVDAESLTLDYSGSGETSRDITHKENQTTVQDDDVASLSLDYDGSRETSPKTSPRSDLNDTEKRKMAAPHDPFGEETEEKESDSSSTPVSFGLDYNGGSIETSPEETLSRKVLRFRDLTLEEQRQEIPPKNRLFQLFSVRVEYGVDKPGKLNGYISALDRDKTLKDGWVGIDSESGCHHVSLFDCQDESIPIVNNGCLPLTDPSCTCALPATKTLELISDFIVTVDDDDQDELEVSNAHITIDFSDFNAVMLFGTCKSFTTKRMDGFITLYFIAFQYAVDATLELWFTSADEEKKKVIGKIVAFYANGFKYDCKFDEEDYYKAVLFEADKSSPYMLDTGKISLRRSRLIAPITCGLVVEADLRDCHTGASILTGSYEFPVSILNGSSTGRIVGTGGCSINLVADWKYDDAYP